MRFNAFIASKTITLLCFLNMPRCSVAMPSVNKKAYKHLLKHSQFHKLKFHSHLVKAHLLRNARFTVVYDAIINQLLIINQNLIFTVSTVLE